MPLDKNTIASNGLAKSFRAELEMVAKHLSICQFLKILDKRFSLRTTNIMPTDDDILIIQESAIVQDVLFEMTKIT